MIAATAVALFIVTGVPAPGAAEQKPTADFYVATNGNDSWSGRLAKPNDGGTDGPFASLERARDAIRRKRSEEGGLKGDLTVLVRGGVYRLDGPLELGPQDGGTDEHSVTWSARPGETPLLSGGRPIKGWQRTGEGLWKTTIPAVKNGDWHFRELFVNGRRATRSRHPNDRFFRIESAEKDQRTHFTWYEGDDFRSDWDNLTDVEIVLFHDWAISRMKLARIDEQARQVQLQHPVGYLGLPFTGFNHFEPHQRYWLENAREFVDSPGEWYLDRETGELFYHPLPGESLDGTEAVAPVATHLLNVEGTLDQPVRNLEFRGFSFSHTGWPLPDVGYGGIQAVYYGHERGEWNRVPVAVVFKSVEDCRFEDNRLLNLGTSGVIFEIGARGNTIAGNEVGHVAGNGIMLGETKRYAPDAPEVSRANTIANNHLHHCGEGYYGAVGIWIGHTQQSRVAHNWVHDHPYTGISIGWTWNPQPTQARANVLEYNHIHDVMQMLADGGGFYTLGFQPDSVIRGNLIHDVDKTHGRAGSNGMFIDEGSKGFLIEENVLYNVGDGAFRFNQTSRENHTFRDNVILESVGPEPPWRERFGIE